MPNGGVYTIQEQIGEGGYSLVYAVTTDGGTRSAVMKEFFPYARYAGEAYAVRDENGVVCAKDDSCREKFRESLERFSREGELGGLAQRESYQILAFDQIKPGYALMRSQSSDMCSIETLVAHWKRNLPVPVGEKDPFFVDEVRVRYALEVVGSLLSVLSAIHSQGILHLDISASNVLWAGKDWKTTGRNCEAFLADFGSSVRMCDGAYHREGSGSYSENFAAPELKKAGAVLTPATDLFSVGKLLYYLCVGHAALLPNNARVMPTRTIRKDLNRLRVRPALRRALTNMILRSMDDDAGARWQSAEEMRTEIERIRNCIPSHPINPSVTCDFTLFSLRSMLTGSEDGTYGWAEELRDRRNIADAELPELPRSPITFREFGDDFSFLQSVLPKQIVRFFEQKLAGEPALSWKNIMLSDYPAQWKRELCSKCLNDGGLRLRCACRIADCLIDDVPQYCKCISEFYLLMGEDAAHLRECQGWGGAIDNPYLGLATLIFYALLGPQIFQEVLLPNPVRTDRLFQLQ